MVTNNYAVNIIGSSLDIIIAADQDRKIILFNKSAEKAFGYSEEEVLGRNVGILYDDPIEGSKVNKTICATGEFIGEVTNRAKDGRKFRTFLSASVLSDSEGNPIGFMGISRDVRDMRKTEKALRKSERFLSTIFDSINDPFSILDRDYRIVRVNEAYAQMKNMEVKDLLGRHCYSALQKRTSVCADCIVEKTFNSGDPCAKDKRLHLPDGSEAWVEIYTYPILNEEGKVSHVIEYTRDITDRRKSEDERRRLIERLEYLSCIDGLTELLNRRVLIDRLTQEVERVARYGSELSLILCDIDYFKEINDTYGHAAGDKALQVVSEILKGSLRSMDILGRYGGDEFMIILPQTSVKGAEEFAERIRLSVEKKSIQITDSDSMNLSLSMGVTGVEPGKRQLDLNSLIKLADNALYSAKRTGRNRVCILT
ncbi:MAG: diguanylate cyclase [Nitrospirae bacterium]|nr:diguanylate cyclase [Nitrospirota bacterium]